MTLTSLTTRLVAVLCTAMAPRISWICAFSSAISLASSALDSAWSAPDEQETSRRAARPTRQGRVVPTFDETEALPSLAFLVVDDVTEMPPNWLVAIRFSPLGSQVRV